MLFLSNPFAGENDLIRATEAPALGRACPQAERLGGEDSTPLAADAKVNEPWSPLLAEPAPRPLLGAIGAVAAPLPSAALWLWLPSL